LTTGMAVTLRRSTRKRLASTCDSAHGVAEGATGSIASSSGDPASSGFRALPDALQPRHSADGAAVAAVDRTVQAGGRAQPASAFASAAAATAAAYGSRPQSPNGPAGPTGSLSSSLPGSAADMLLTKRPSNKLPTHLPPLPRAPSGTSAAGTAAAAAGTGGSGAGGSATGGAWHMLGGRSSSGMVLPQGAAGTASGAAGDGLSGGALDSLLPQSLRK
jgi:hypothetical protein